MSVCPICGGAVFRGRLADQEREGPVCGGHPNEELAKLRAENEALRRAAIDAEEAAQRARESLREQMALNEALRAEAEDHGDDMAQVLARAERAEAERDALRAENERLRGVLQRLIDANPRYNAGERLQLDLEAALAGEKP